MVEGTVVGREGSQAAVPLVGVAVVVKGSLRNHAVTDLQGRYSIRVPSSTDTLQFTYLGYKPLERVVGSRTRLDVEMLSESQQVDAVVVTALGLTRKEKSLGYAVSTVGSEDLNNTVTNNWLNGMAGKVAGLNFDTSSAGPGGSIRVTLRGEGSLAYDKNEALFVVDGVPINSGMTSNTENGSYGSTVSTIDYGNGASDLNPDDIESVSVLKGPAATALYGSRAANGAIIITTKSGLKSGGLRVTFNSNVTLEQAGFWPDFQEEYGSGVYESAQIDGVTTPPEYSYWNVAADKSDTGQKITRYHARSSFGERYDPSKMRYIYSSRNWDTDEYTRKPWVAQDWYKGFFRTGVTYSNSISIEGGNGKGNSARVSFKDMRNDWIVPNTGYESQNLSFSFSTRISKAVTVSGKANYYRKNSDNLPSAGYSTASPLYALIWNPSSVSVDDMYAEWSEGRIAAMNAAGTTGSGNLINPSSDNPYFMVYEQLNTQDRDRVYGNVSVNVNIWREKLTAIYSNSDFQGGYRLSSAIQNYNIKPENIESWETGIEARLFGGRIGLDVAYYDSTTTDQIITVPADWATGAASKLINAGEVNNRGVEVALDLRPVETKNWRWDIGLNWSKNWNELVALAPGVEMWQLNSKLTVGSTVFTYAYPGGVLGRLYGIGYETAPEGSFYVDEAGKFVDCSGARIIDAETGNPVLTETLKDLGSIYPNYKAGLNTRLSYKGLSLAMTFTAQQGGRAYSVTSAVLSTLGKLENSLPGRYDGLIADGVNLHADGTYSKNRTVTRNVVEYYNLYAQYRNNIEQHVYSTSFLKLKELRLDYSFPEQICRRLRVVRSIQLGFFATNLFCWTKWPQYDPEVASWAGGSLSKGVETGGYPMTRTYGFNLKLTF